MWNKKACFAGKYYPAEKQDLEKELDYYLKYAELPEFKGEPVAVLAPHDAYFRSGAVAAYAHRLLASMKPEVVIILAPAHNADYLGASYIDEGTYETLLGTLNIDPDISSAVMRRPNFFFIKEVHDTEYSAEVQIPFLQRAMAAAGNDAGFTVVPLIIATKETTTLSKLGDSLADIIKADGRKTAVLVSADLSCNHRDEDARKMDLQFLETLKSLDETEIRNAAVSGAAETDSLGPLLTAVRALKKLGVKNFEPFVYATSGDTTGNRESVYGYCAAAFTR